ncbi:uncharacterized protein PHACADRAFT_246520 [Phanerochaete carnosa HHB-10118-sp]|uniref:Uncharacterized protein n=1 Tax=Phanerochaete carnosa (strain HHB-10118-sp) TaxID=650164 RepID=K5VC70_PHACS|nr:uncharacterized protein PHACADRAFT_246520 [Phanerochaete carnosa HHB-10118-sp]EKM60521.1 hypothetical protein PHACADRAFT_246520 [Phanerochaete carnosa HHB-10118-sp]
MSEARRVSEKLSAIDAKNSEESKSTKVRRKAPHSVKLSSPSRAVGCLWSSACLRDSPVLSPTLLAYLNSCFLV